MMAAALGWRARRASATAWHTVRSRRHLQRHRKARGNQLDAAELVPEEKQELAAQLEWASWTAIQCGQCYGGRPEEEKPKVARDDDDEEVGREVEAKQGRPALGVSVHRGIHDKKRRRARARAAAFSGSALGRGPGRC
jgi:hypothetical protein